MQELPIEYFISIAEKFVFISIFMGGISATILGTLVVVKNGSKRLKWMMLFLSIAAVSFIVAVFGMNKVLVILTPDSPYEKTEDVLFYPRLVGGLAFYLGIYALLTVIGLSGWINSKRLGWATTLISGIAGFLIFTLT